MVTLVAYGRLPRHWRASFLLLISYAFYTSISPQFVVVLAYVTIASFLGVRALERYHSMWLLWTLITLVMVPLVLLKVIPSEITVFFGRTPAESILSRAAVPLGVSFYTLQAVGALVDVYLRKTNPPPTLVAHALFLAFFPLLLAGPIERQAKLIPQIVTLRRPGATDLYVGAKTALWGYFCKLAIADSIGSLVDNVFDGPELATPAGILFALVLYSFQIYFDFYGYSLIALGLGRSFGIRLTPNFAHPYSARTLREFWRRWHITLSTWLRDYVYRPIRGRSENFGRFALAVLTTFVASALWHGFGLNFLMWGLFHALAFVVIEGAISFVPISAIPRGSWGKRASNAAGVASCFAIVTFGWLFFRVSDIGDIGMFVMRILSWDSPSLARVLDPFQANTVTFLVALAVAVALDWTGIANRVTDVVPRNRREFALELVVVNTAVLGLVLIGDLGTRDFIYFQF